MSVVSDCELHVQERLNRIFLAYVSRTYLKINNRVGMGISRYWRVHYYPGNMTFPICMTT